MQKTASMDVTSLQKLEKTIFDQKNCRVVGGT